VGRARAGSRRRPTARSCGHGRALGRVYIIDRTKFEVAGKIEFLPPGMRKTDVTPVGPHHDQGRSTAFVTLGTPPCGGGRRAHAARSRLYPGRQALVGVTLSRDERTLYVANGFGDDIR